MAAAADDEMIAAATGLLRSFGAAEDPVAEQAAGLVKRITEDPGLQRVAQLAEMSGLSERKLQRLFSDYVGVSPKWVMRRARLHEAALRVDADGPGLGGLGGARGRPRLRRSGPPDQGFHRDPGRAAEPLRGRPGSSRQPPGPLAYGISVTLISDITSATDAIPGPTE